MTRMMILGLLNNFGSMSGYEIQQMLQSSQTEMWAYVQPASIYHALRKLQQEGKIILETVEHTGLRAKAIYKIAEDGVLELRQLIEQSLSKSSVVFPASLYTALTFMDELPVPLILEALGKQEREIAAVMAAMKHGEEMKAQAGAMTVQAEAVFTNIYAQVGMQLEFIRKLIVDLESRQEGESL
ncbi:PadR family transcriptional regulator [Paenibacillus albidus]|uniref:PadR family transcriptional regulator n=1 Tax=Paenibacillus albidus TaxID=2041023 RepID=UPI0020357C75|nr:PadR family transcriptional regulator [Paenibacillus albidus]